MKSIIAFIFLFGVTTLLFAGDLSSCADELDRLRKAARDTVDLANDANSKSESLNSCRGKFISRNNRNSCSNESSDFQSAKSSLSNELDTVRRRYKNVIDACGVDDVTLAPSQRTGDAQCDMYRTYLGKLPIAALLKTCTQYMPQGECEKCMSFRPSVPGSFVPLK